MKLPTVVALCAALEGVYAVPKSTPRDTNLEIRTDSPTAPLFSQSCVILGVGKGILTSKCQYNNTQVLGSLDPNDCLGNEDGVLTGAQNGNCSWTCHNWGSNDGPTIWADCNTRNGDPVQTRLNLDVVVSNGNGVPVCFGVYGDVISTKEA